jgi:archaellum component FlaC
MNGMSVVEDVRKVLQDFLAPELRNIDARLDSLEKVMNAKFESVDVKFDGLGRQIQGISEKLDIDRRLIALESRHPSATQQ